MHLWTTRSKPERHDVVIAIEHFKEQSPGVSRCKLSSFPYDLEQASREESVGALLPDEREGI